MIDAKLLHENITSWRVCVLLKAWLCKTRNKPWHGDFLEQRNGAFLLASALLTFRICWFLRASSSTFRLQALRESLLQAIMKNRQKCPRSTGEELCLGCVRKTWLQGGLVLEMESSWWKALHPRHISETNLYYTMREEQEWVSISIPSSVPSMTFIIVYLSYSREREATKEVWDPLDN